MKKLTFTFCLIIVSMTTFSQSKLGDMACVYVTTTDLDSSAAIYKKLGFSVIGSNTFPVPWTQVSDGSLVIMMRKDANPYMGLTYYGTDVDVIAGNLEKDGIVFTQKPKDGDPIKRYYFKDPDGFTIMLVSNLGGFIQPTGVTLLNMNQGDYQNANKYPNQHCGAFGEFCHPVKDLDAAITFWTRIGYTLKYKQTQPYPHAIMSDGLMIIGLHQTNNFNYPAITYFGLNTAKRIEQLKENGLHDFSDMQGKNNQVLKTYEGQHFFVFSLGM